MKKMLKSMAVLATLAMIFGMAACSGSGSDDDYATSTGISNKEGASISSSSTTSTDTETDDESSTTLDIAEDELETLVTGTTVAEAVSGSSIFISGRTVEISDFYICDHEVTQAEYQAIIEQNPSNFQASAADGEKQEARPVEKVSWYDALVYCNLRSVKEGYKPCYTIKGSTNPSDWGDVPTSSDDTWNAAECNFTANGYRLPTEAEWEYAACGGNVLTGEQTDYAGSSSADEVAWYGSNSGNKTHEVMKRKENSLGLYDMTGNVWEWCWDWYGDIESTTANSGLSSGSHRVKRGGSWYETNCITVYYREGRTANTRDDIQGFRCVQPINI